MKKPDLPIVILAGIQVLDCIPGFLPTGWAGLSVSPFTLQERSSSRPDLSGGRSAKIKEGGANQLVHPKKEQNLKSEGRPFKQWQFT